MYKLNLKLEGAFETNEDISDILEHVRLAILADKIRGTVELSGAPVFCDWSVERG